MQSLAQNEEQYDPTPLLLNDGKYSIEREVAKCLEVLEDILHPDELRFLEPVFNQPHIRARKWRERHGRST